ncbi:HEXXH motif-containing putative peptide modification protein [Streptomyces sp. NPDC004111]|uniref:aKG-HExxH-type peptide beta-hydroxylase n=1 Tax=Streptomyces sp. NPDC004111 TaxID=3364690 RepID=UPI0036B42A54
MADRLRCLALPGAEPDIAFMDAVVAAHAEGLAAALLTRHGEEIAAHSEDLTEAITPPWKLERPLRDLWDPAIGTVERLLESGSGDPTSAAVELGLCLARAGHRPRGWSAETARELRPRWNDVLLPAFDRVTLHAGTGLRIETQRRADGTAHTVWAGPGVGPGAGAGAGAADASLPGAKELVPVNGTSLRLLPEACVREQMAIEDDFHTIVTFPEPTKELGRSFADAMDLMRDRAPHYEQWVVRVVHAVVPCDSGASRTRSSSWRDAPGVVLVSVSPQPAAVAEMLVHESCHQYYYLAKRLGDVVDPADTRLYYSPAVDRERPLDRVLLAYHAFANVLLLHEALGTPGILDRMRRDTEQLGAPLRDNSSLTPVGRALVQPLMERLS